MSVILDLLQGYEEIEESPRRNWIGDNYLYTIIRILTLFAKFFTIFCRHKQPPARIVCYFD